MTAEHLANALAAAVHALRSYQHGNTAPDLAASIADAGTIALQAAGYADPLLMVAQAQEAARQRGLSVEICDRADRAARIRAVPLGQIAVLATAIAESAPVMKVFAAPEWDCLTEDGQQWVAAIVRETIARAVEQVL